MAPNPINLQGLKTLGGSAHLADRSFEPPREQAGGTAQDPGRARVQGGAMDLTKPYEFIGFGAMDTTKPYEFIGFGAMDITKPYEFIGFGAMDAKTQEPGAGQTRSPGMPGEHGYAGTGVLPGGLFCLCKPCWTSSRVAFNNLPASIGPHKGSIFKAPESIFKAP